MLRWCGLILSVIYVSWSGAIPQEPFEPYYYYSNYDDPPHNENRERVNQRNRNIPENLAVNGLSNFHNTVTQPPQESFRANNQRSDRKPQTKPNVGCHNRCGQTEMQYGNDRPTWQLKESTNNREYDCECGKKSVTTTSKRTPVEVTTQTTNPMTSGQTPTNAFGSEDLHNRDSKSLLDNSLLTFTADLIRNVMTSTGNNENVIFSPINIFVALALLHLGSSGTTLDEVTRAMRLPQNYHTLDVHDTLSRLLSTTRNYVTHAADGKDIFQVNYANGIFVQDKSPIKADYLEKTQFYYNGEVANLDFNRGSEAAEYINRWITSKTDGQIPSPFTSSLSKNTQIILVSSLYFTAGWSEVFLNQKTNIEPFYSGTEQIQIRMMNKISRIPYLNNEYLQFEAITLDFHRRIYSAVFILPHSSQSLTVLAHKLKSEDLHALFTMSSMEGVDCKIPKFKFSSSKSLKESLQALGLANLFKKANLSNLLQKGDFLRVSDIKHAAEIVVDELGTKATAATSLQVELLSAKPRPNEPIKFHLNRPFMMMIFHRATEAVLFAVKVNTPTE